MDTPESLVYIAEGSFGLLDAGEIPAHTADWSNGFVATMQCGALIATGTHTGYVRVQAISQHYRPDLSPADARWDEIVEVTVRAPHGKLSVESLEQGPATGLPVLSSSGAGEYRVRVHAKGRADAFDQSHEEPVEAYLLQVWPTEGGQPTAIIRSSKQIERSLRTPAPPNPAPAQNEGAKARQEQLRQRLLRGGRSE
ncbi:MULTISPECIES: hypothetical protein [unclassified Streptomyces]|uniref:hypothetical protein n=1 Tax=unclassified Streptomyces TaxID=2593676 RepID=UPI00224DDBFC|nr:MULTISPECIES: hypothetical protein [unclassified Streptomyces]MCX5052081.1 hypothetical protein [Streptomyces sp. NBC_00474]MCX5063427.1 hypothetical protein [Streptomyces sp. NBC_00452]MCX5251279.1 hypothetical protein [Streptomyces sp. NBC_00201]MCX5294798.1 hypothetical protein [Streptomyces sp. NBC_00183]